jgi:hypothetical protein
MRFITSLLGAGFLSILFVSSAAGQAQRTFVSANGNDGNSCGHTDPCRTFAEAVSQTSPGGEVIVLDSAGYGPFTIKQAITIEAPGGLYAGISVSSGDGIDVSAGPSDSVVLRGLTVNNKGGSGSGIVFNSGNELYVEGCLVTGFSSATGIAAVGPGDLMVKDSTVRGNGTGISVQPSAAAMAAIQRVSAEANSTGLSFTGPITATLDLCSFLCNEFVGLSAGDGSSVTVRGSIASGNTRGFAAHAKTSLPVQLNLENCVASNNADAGFIVGPDIVGPDMPSFVGRVSNSTITHNGTGLSVIGPGVLLSRGNNTVEGNQTDVSGKIASYSPK